MSPQIKHNGIKFTLKLFLKTFVSQMQHKLWHLWCILHMQYYVINSKKYVYTVQWIYYCVITFERAYLLPLAF